MPQSNVGQAKTASSDDYNCPICLCLLHQPVVTSCGHEYCQGCYTQWVAKSGLFSAQPLACPVCRQTLSRSIPGVSKRLAELIDASFPEMSKQRRIQAKQDSVSSSDQKAALTHSGTPDGRRHPLPTFNFSQSPLHRFSMPDSYNPFRDPFLSRAPPDAPPALPGPFDFTPALGSLQAGQSTQGSQPSAQRPLRHSGRHFPQATDAPAMDSHAASTPSDAHSANSARLAGLTLRLESLAASIARARAAEAGTAGLNLPFQSTQPAPILSMQHGLQPATGVGLHEEQSSLSLPLQQAPAQPNPSRGMLQQHQPPARTGWHQGLTPEVVNSNFFRSMPPPGSLSFTMGQPPRHPCNPRRSAARSRVPSQPRRFRRHPLRAARQVH